MKVFNIKWDTGGDKDALASLPKTVKPPEDLFSAEKFETTGDLLDAVSDWLSDEYGFCHDGFEVEGVENAP